MPWVNVRSRLWRSRFGVHGISPRASGDRLRSITEGIPSPAPTGRSNTDRGNALGLPVSQPPALKGRNNSSFDSSVIGITSPSFTEREQWPIPDDIVQFPTPYQGDIFDDGFVEVHGYGVIEAATATGACRVAWVGFGKQPSTTPQNAASFPALILPSE